MNAAELATLAGVQGELNLDRIKELAVGLAERNGRAVFVTLAERGILAATADAMFTALQASRCAGRLMSSGQGIR